MQLFNKKGADPSFNVIIALILGLVLIATVVAILYFTQGQALNAEFAQSFGCWMTNTMKCGGGVLSSMPSLCMYNIQEESVDLPQFATMVTDTWWMYKEGECNFGNANDEIFPAFSFKPTNDINVKDYFEYILTTKNGREVPIENSDFAYIHGNTEARPICFDGREKIDNKKNTIGELYLEAGETYYIMFYDDQLPHEEGDIILISSSPKFDAGYWKEIKFAATAGFISTQLSGLIAGATTEGITIIGYDPKGGVCLPYGPKAPN